MIEGKSTHELNELYDEIEQNLSSDRSFAIELQYWQNLLKKIKIQIAKISIEEIYDTYEKQNHERIQTEIKIAEAKKVLEKKKLKEQQDVYQ